MIKDMVFGTVGGLGLFLFGMGIMSEGLKKIASQRARKLLSALTQHRVIAVIVGALVTCLIQSSSATTVMTVGFVNAGLLTLKQALSVVLGANIGTTFTAWLVSALAVFKITSYALPAIGIGFFMQLFCKKQKRRDIGRVVLGFGILFIGIGFMKDGFAPLKESDHVQHILIYLGQNPIFAVLAGAVITMLLQSSSATIAMVQILAFNGAFGTDWDIALRVVIPYILGDNIGTTITAEIASLRTSLNARRTARGHTLFNVIGVLYMLPIVWGGWYGNWVEYIVPGTLTQNNIMVHIAVAHSLFNIVNTLVFIPLIRVLEGIVVRFVKPQPGEETEKPMVLEEHLLATPELAMNQARSEITRMVLAAQKSTNCALDGLRTSDSRKLQAARKLEDALDDFQYEITSYLSTLSRKELSDELSSELPVLLHTVNDLERIGDHAVNIAEIAERKISQNQVFSESAKLEIDRLRHEINQMFEAIFQSLAQNDSKAAKRSLLNEQNLNKMQIDFRKNHVQRMTEGICTPETGLIFIDLVDNIEKIGDHLTNIAQSVIGGLQWDGVEEIHQKLEESMV